MKKILLLGFLMVVLLALCAAAILIAPPIITAAVLLFKGGDIATTAVGLPHIVGVMTALCLLPTTVVLAIQFFSPKFRKWVAIGFITLALLSTLLTAAKNHKDDFAPAFHSVLEHITQWETARHDRRLAELASQNESVKQSLQIQQQQLQIADAALRAEKAAHLREQQVFVDRLLKQLSDGQNSLKLTMANMENPSLRSVVEANLSLAEASSALSSAATNGSSDLPSLQMIVEGAISKSAQAQNEIQAASAAREAAMMAANSTLKEKDQQTAAQLQKLADERQQAEVAARNAADVAERLQPENVMSHQPDLAAASQTQPEERWPKDKWGLRKKIRHWVGGDSNASVATVRIQNSTGYLLYVTFSSSSQQHIWPEQGSAFVAQPGETITVRLAGTPGEAIFYKAWAAQYPSLVWASCDCGPDNRLAPLAIVGRNDDDNPQSIALVIN